VGLQFGLHSLDFSWALKDTKKGGKEKGLKKGKLQVADLLNAFN